MVIWKNIFICYGVVSDWFLFYFKKIKKDVVVLFKIVVYVEY